MNFQIGLDELVSIVKMYQEKAEDGPISPEVRYLQKKGGNKFLLHGLYTHPNKGIRKSSIDDRIDTFGSNDVPVKQSKGYCELFLESLSDFSLQILIVAAVASMVLEQAFGDQKTRETGWIEGFSILLAVMVCALVTTTNNYQKERQFRKLNEISQGRKVANVIRENELINVHQGNIVTGDIVYVREGMEIPVDGWLIESAEIYADESSMTGETEPVPKNSYEACISILKSHKKGAEIPSPILMSGTKVLNGEGKMIALVVGKNSCLGKIRTLIEQRQTSHTPLQKKLEVLASDIGRFGLYAAILIAIILLIRFTVERLHSQTWQNSKQLPELINIFLISITVIVVAIPQGLPLAVTLTLAYSVRKMLMDNNLVRRMEACQTMGGASLICSDKTGTLTMNKMNVVAWWNFTTVDVPAYTDAPITYYDMDPAFKQYLLSNIFLNSNAELRPEQNGSATQLALMFFGERLGEKYNVYRNQYTVLHRFPFNSTRKRMSVICQMDHKTFMFTKGASQFIVGGCVKILNYKTNQVSDIDTPTKTDIMAMIKKMAEKGLRTMVLAYKQLNMETDDITSKNQDGVYNIESKDLTLLAIFGLRDLPREEVPDAIKQCKRAGIRVKMVTGDNIITATAIARDIGIIEPGRPSICLQGPEFNRMVGGIVCSLCRTAICDCTNDPNDKSKPFRKDVIKNEEDFDRVIKHLDVLARSRPEDKYALVTGLINKGYVVAVTGDGTNDAPALKKADVGFAMGRSGTQIAREASSIVLLDDNFNSIVKAVMWGRNIYDCIKKFVQFQITVNIVAVCITLVGATMLRQQILRPIQMLWINLIMDTLASLALATEPPNEALLDRKPHLRDEYIITKKMWKHIITQAIFQIVVILFLVFLGDNFIPEYPDDFDNVIGSDLSAKYNSGFVRSGRFKKLFSDESDFETVFRQYAVYSRHFTFIFNTFVFMQIFNFFNSRKLYDEINVFNGICNNVIFILVVFMIVILQLIIISFGSVAFGLYQYYGLSSIQWVMSVAIGSCSLIVSVLTKLFPETKMCMDVLESENDSKHRTNRAYMLALKMREPESEQDDLTE